MKNSIIKTNSKSMLSHFYERTKHHIALVNIFYSKIISKYPELQNEYFLLHDDSKFHESEQKGFVYLTWNYYCLRKKIPFILTEEQKQLTISATIHHILHNKHHPEYWDKDFTINKDGIPITPVNATAMPSKYVAEMIADWLAMSNEKQTNPFDWAEMTIGKRWIFTEEQQELIYKLLKEFY